VLLATIATSSRRCYYYHYCFRSGNVLKTYLKRRGGRTHGRYENVSFFPTQDALSGDVAILRYDEMFIDFARKKKKPSRWREFNGQGDALHDNLNACTYVCLIYSTRYVIYSIIKLEQKNKYIKRCQEER